MRHQSHQRLAAEKAAKIVDGLGPRINLMTSRPNPEAPIGMIKKASTKQRNSVEMFQKGP